VTLRVLIGYSASPGDNQRNLNVHQRLRYLSARTNVQAVLPRGAVVDPVLVDTVDIRRPRLPGTGAVAVSLACRAWLGRWDVVLTDRSIASLGGWLGTRGRKAAWIADVWDLPDKELVTYYRDAQRTQRLRRLAARAKNALLRCLLRRADAVLISILPEALSAYGLSPARMYTYGNAIDLSAHEGAGERDSRALCYATSVFLPDRGLPTLVAAVDLLAQDGEDLRVHLIGEITEEGHTALRTSSVANCFITHGVLPIDAAHTIMRRCQVGVLPFHDNPDLAFTFPVKMLEYMDAGAVVVASRLPGIASVIDSGRNGILTQPGSADELADAVLSLLRDRSLVQRLRGAARADVLRHDAAQKAEAIYRDLVTVVERVHSG
jgi:hypothetical protein